MSDFRRYLLYLILIMYVDKKIKESFLDICMNIITKREEKTFYQALIEKNGEYEGVFFVGVKTTKVFCRPTCPARKPKLENCEFYRTAQEALLASFRPCQRCHPLSSSQKASDLINLLVDAVEANPEKRWKESDFKKLSVNPATVRRHFTKRFNMTFIEYARARRMGIAFKEIRKGHKVIDTQLNVGYESGSGFRDAFSKIMGVAPAKIGELQEILKACWIDTPLGPMLAISDEKELYLLEFVDRRGLEKEIEKLRIKKKSAIIPGSTFSIKLIKKELELYFSGNLKKFTTPIHMLGSSFQKKVWKELIKIPYGETRSYLQQAKAISLDKAVRAVANANGANQIAIVIPCHRIINHNGKLGGYGGSLARKKWLIAHEKQQSEKKST